MIQNKIKLKLHNLKKRKYEKLISLAKTPKFYTEKNDEQNLHAKLRQEGYYSQAGQDKWLAENIFSGKKSGVFVEIGAHDGISFSNTFFFEKMLNWTGIAVEPIPEVYNKLKKNRKCVTLHGCIAGRNGKVEFQVVSGRSQMLSGITNKYNKAHLKRIDSELNSYSGEAQKIILPCFTLNELLQQHKLYHVDYLSIDVEGAEYSILKKFNFRRFHISVMGIENNYNDYRIPQLLNKMGFRIHSILGDEFYINVNDLSSLGEMPIHSAPSSI